MLAHFPNGTTATADRLRLARAVVEGTRLSLKLDSQRVGMAPELRRRLEE